MVASLTWPETRSGAWDRLSWRLNDLVQVAVYGLEGVAQRRAERADAGDQPERDRRRDQALRLGVTGIRPTGDGRLAAALGAKITMEPQSDRIASRGGGSRRRHGHAVIWNCAAVSASPVDNLANCTAAPAPLPSPS